MSRFFSSDFHLGSTLINKYAHRPFASGKEAIDKLIDNCNATASSKLDTVIHVGDFALDGVDRHDGEDESCLGCSIRELPLFFNARLVLLTGNHDDGHNATTDAKSMTIDLNQNYWNVSVAHYPSYHESYHYVGNGNRNSCSGRIHIHLCGHVHDKWLLNFDARHKVLNVNVGTDVWGYKPVRDSELTDLLDYFRATMWTKIEPSPGKWTNFVMTRKAFDEFKVAHSAEVTAEREARKQERYEKKGLTPEECERRKQEGIKASKVKKLQRMTKLNEAECKAALEAYAYDLYEAFDRLESVTTWL